MVALCKRKAKFAATCAVNPITQRCLYAVFLVALVTAAALWTAAEAHEVEFAQASAEAYEIELLQVYEDEFIQSQISEPDEPRVCEPPSDGAWEVSDSLLGSPVYHFNMSAVTESVYQGAPMRLCIYSR